MVEPVRVGQPRPVTSSTLVAARTRRRFAAPVDLEAVRLRSEQAVAEVAAAPVQHLPAALLEALHGSWGTPAELGLAQERRLRLVVA